MYTRFPLRKEQQRAMKEVTKSFVFTVFSDPTY